MGCTGARPRVSGANGHTRLAKRRQGEPSADLVRRPGAGDPGRAATLGPEVAGCVGHEGQEAGHRPGKKPQIAERPTRKAGRPAKQPHWSERQRDRAARTRPRATAFTSARSERCRDGQRGPRPGSRMRPCRAMGRCRAADILTHRTSASSGRVQPPRMIRAKDSKASGFAATTSPLDSISVPGASGSIRPPASLTSRMPAAMSQACSRRSQNPS